MFVSDYDVLSRLSKNRKGEQILDRKERYMLGRLIGLGLIVEKESPAAEMNPAEDIRRKLRSEGNSVLNDVFKRINGNYQITSFGKLFVKFLEKSSGNS
jgi:hypothetical protein